jgi:nitrogen fixation-related uncharacterized protein
MWSLIPISILLLLVAVGTHLWQRQAWQRQQRDATTARERDFYALRQRRRSQISLLMGGVAGAMFLGAWITAPLVVGLLWLGVLLVLLWIMLLALLDAHSSQAFLNRQRIANLAEHAAWQRQQRGAREPRPGDSET